MGFIGSEIKVCPRVVCEVTQTGCEVTQTVTLALEPQPQSFWAVEVLTELSSALGG